MVANGYRVAFALTFVGLIPAFEIARQTDVSRPSGHVILRSMTRTTSLASTRSVATEGTKSTKPQSAGQSDASDDRNARFLAARALITKTGSAAFAVDRLESNKHYSTLSTRDRSFARLLVTTTERRLGQIDEVLRQCQKETKSRPNRVDQFVQAALRIGATQLLFLKVPEHAAVKETVELLRHDPKTTVPESRIKFVNAVLRRISREGDVLLATTDVTQNASPWLVKEWQKSWGEEATRKIVALAMEETPRVLTIKQHPGSQLEKPMGRIKAVAALFEDSEILPQGSVRVNTSPPGSIINWPEYSEGSWWLQDAAATTPAIALYNALSKNGETSVAGLDVVDMCASPGGKTAQLWNYGFASVTAVEVAEKRTERLRQNMQRLNMDCEVVVADGAQWTSQHESVAGMLLDVPCTATGTGSKRPDVLRREENYQELLETQFRLACHAIDSILGPGGILVYATCSLLRKESEDQVNKLLNRNEGARVETIPITPGEIPGFDDAIDENGWLRVIPGTLEGGLSQCDGFFVARLKKIS
jgi:16S rRNA (cytosine967-C5)-methyltransferase